MEQAFKLAKKVLTLDESNSHVYDLLSWLYLLTREHEKAIAAAEKSVDLNPNHAMSYMFLGRALKLAGRYQEAVDNFKKGLRVDPLNPFWNFVQLCTTNRMIGRYDEAIAYCEPDQSEPRFREGGHSSFKQMRILGFPAIFVLTLDVISG